MDDEKDEGPLSSEQLKRDEWRGEGTSLGKDEAGGHTLPESERDRATDHSGGRDGPRPFSGTMLPPD